MAEYAKDHGYVVAVTADHGNIETLYNKEGKPHVAHTTNLVPFIVLDPQGRDIALHDGRLGDVAPTVLSVLGLEQPAEMTGTSLIETPGFTNKKMMLIILDGWGFGTADDKDAIFSADTPAWDGLLAKYPNSRLRASGEDVGLQAGKPGNSEAGHSNLGAGRVVAQDDVRMDRAIQDGSFKTNPVFLQAIANARENHKPLHLLAYLTEKSSHGCIDYPLMLVEMAEGVEEIDLHIIFDGRSTEPGSAPAMLRTLEERLGSAEGPVLPEDQLAGGHHRAGPQGHQHMGAHTGRAMGILPLRTDDRSHQHGQEHTKADIQRRQGQRGHIHHRYRCCCHSFTSQIKMGTV